MSAHGPKRHPDEIRIVRFFPEIRSAHLERDATMAPGRYVFTATRTDLDPGLMTEPGRWTRVRRSGLFLTGFRLDADVVEIPEPLWLRVVPQSVALLLGLKLANRLRRRRTIVVSYAIENATLDRRPDRLRFLPQALWGAIATRTAALTLNQVDRLVFGSDSARSAYSEVAAEQSARAVVAHAEVVLGLPSACPCPESGSGRTGQVLFLGALEPRKGLNLLLECWSSVRRSHPNARLQVIGRGPLEGMVRMAAAADPSIRYEPVEARGSVHRALRGCSVVVLASQPQGRWREQIGLPICEAVAHGCTVVTTSETGLAKWLDAAGHRVLAVPTAPGDLAAAVVNALDDPATDSRPLLPSVDGRCQADSVLVLGDSKVDDLLVGRHV